MKLMGVTALSVCVAAVAVAPARAMASVTDTRMAWQRTATAAGEHIEVVGFGRLAGTGHATPESFTSDPDGSFAGRWRISLTDGAITFNFAGQTTRFVAMPQICGGHATLAGTFILDGGTGRLAGVTGRGDLAAETLLRGHRLPEGTCAPQRPDEYEIGVATAS